jgi:hypothetical protein
MHLTIRVGEKYISMAKGVTVKSKFAKKKKKKKAKNSRAKKKRGRKKKVVLQEARDAAKDAASQSRRVLYEKERAAINCTYDALRLGKAHLDSLDRVYRSLRSCLPRGVIRGSTTLFSNSASLGAHDFLDLVRWRLLPYVLRYSWRPGQLKAMSAVLESLRDFKANEIPSDHDFELMETRVVEALCAHEVMFPKRELVSVYHLMIHVSRDLKLWGPARHRCICMLHFVS